MSHLRLKAARKLGITEIPVILCDEWTESQVKAFRLVVNRSVTWAEWDDELLSLELQELAAADFNLELTGFDPRELEDLLTLPDNDEQADLAQLRKKRLAWSRSRNSPRTPWTSERLLNPWYNPGQCHSN